MKKKFLSIAISAALICGMTACGDLSISDTPVSDLSASETDDEVISASDEAGGDSSISAGEEAGTQMGDVSADPYETNRGPGLLSLSVTSMYDYEYSDEYEQILASYTYTTVGLDEEYAAAFPELDQALNKRNEEKKEKSNETYKELISFAKEDIVAYPDSFSEHETTEEVAVRRADTRVLSLLYEGYYYAGGAHGGYYYYGENYDTQTGEKLTLSDVITDMEQLPDLVQEQLDIYWGDVDFYDDLDLKEYFQDPDREISWTLDYNGITIFFNPYDIAPYASGAQNVTILFESHPELFEMQYQNAADRYAVQLSFENPFYFDLDHDGTAEQILTTGVVDEYDTYTTQSVEVNGHWYEEEIHGYSIEPLFLYTADGQSYLYIQNKLDNDWRLLTVYDLSSGDAQKVDSINAGWPEIYSEEPVYYPTCTVITDPEHFRLDSHTELLSTRTGSRPYHVGEDGMPAADQEYYDLSVPIPFTLNQSLDAALVDSESGDELGQTTIEPGTEVEYYRTDEEKFAYLLLPDGRTARIEVEIRDWERFVQGVDIYELFDGIIFAG